jgi:hypothetical protein
MQSPNYGDTRIGFKPNTPQPLENNKPSLFRDIFKSIGIMK